MNRTPEADYLVELRQILEECFDESELRTFCFDLHIDYDSLRAESKADGARELVGYFNRRGNITELDRAVRQSRPEPTAGLVPPPTKQKFFSANDEQDIASPSWNTGTAAKRLVLVSVVTLVLGSILGALGYRAVFSRRTPAQLSPDFERIPLGQLRESIQSDLGPGSGRPDLYTVRVPFETGWTVRTQCRDAQSASTSISIGTGISQATGVHLVMHGGWVIKDYDHQQAGLVRLRFSDGTVHETPLVVGFNLRDWVEDNLDAIRTVTSPDVQQVWQGTSPYNIPGHLDWLAIWVPEKYRDARLTNIEIIDTSHELNGSQDPCIHVLAATVEHLEKP
jgi:hypothetical protein